MRVSPNASGAVMNSVPDNTGNYIYGDIYNGGTYTSSPLVNNTGITWSYRGFDMGPEGRATKASITTTQRVADPDHIGQFIDLPNVDVVIPLTGPSAKTPDEGGDAINGTVIAHGHKNVFNNKQAHSKITHGKHIDLVEKELNQR